MNFSQIASFDYQLKSIYNPVGHPCIKIIEIRRFGFLHISKTSCSALRETGRFNISTNYNLLALGKVHYLSSITVPFLCIGLPL